MPTGIIAALLEHLRPVQRWHIRAGHYRAIAHRLFGARPDGECGVVVVVVIVVKRVYD